MTPARPFNCRDCGQQVRVSSDDYFPLCHDCFVRATKARKGGAVEPINTGCVNLVLLMVLAFIVLFGIVYKIGG